MALTIKSEDRQALRRFGMNRINNDNHKYTVSVFFIENASRNSTPLEVHGFDTEGEAEEQFRMLNPITYFQLHNIGLLNYSSFANKGYLTTLSKGTKEIKQRYFYIEKDVLNSSRTMILTNA